MSCVNNHYTADELESIFIWDLLADAIPLSREERRGCREREDLAREEKREPKGNRRGDGKLSKEEALERHREYMRKWRAENREHIRERDAAYREKHRAEINERQRKYAEEKKARRLIPDAQP